MSEQSLDDMCQYKMKEYDPIYQCSVCTGYRVKCNDYTPKYNLQALVWEQKNRKEVEK